MVSGRRVLIRPLEAAFLKAEIESGKNDRVKRALQTLCKLYWGNQSLLPTDRVAIENTILGTLNRGTSDEKVRRWSLSALAQLGQPNACWDTVINVLQTRQSEPQVISAAIAASFKMKPREASSVLTKLDFLSQNFLMLSALQSVDIAKYGGDVHSLRVEDASPTELKLALILVGLGKAPEHCFDPKHDNRQLVRALCGHHDPLVSQYSIWATAENPALTAKDLGIDALSVDSLAPNVRSYIYRLYASERSWSDHQQQLVEAGSLDELEEARLGCAIGLRDTYFEGVEDIVLEWYERESSEHIPRYLVEHVVRQAQKSDHYTYYATDLFQSARSDAGLRRVMIAAAEGHPLYSVLKKVEYDEEAGSLFGGTPMTVKVNTINMSGQAQLQISNTGSNSSTGATNTQVIHDPQQILKEIGDLLASAPFKSSLLEAALIEVKEVEADPAPERLASVAKTLQNCEAAVAASEGIWDKASSLAGKIALFLAASGAVG